MKTIYTFIRRQSAYVFIGICMISGAFLRLYNTNWDQGHFFHPDERNIDNAVSGIHFFSQLNPHFFAYGGFPIYFYRFVGEIFAFSYHTNVWVSDWGYINIIGRSCAGMFSVFTILAVYLLAKTVFTKPVALLSTFFTTITVGFIQIAHFSITENILAFFSVFICYLCIHLLHKPHIFLYIRLATALGISMATKTTAIIFLILPLVTQLYLIKKLPHKRTIYSTYTLVMLGVTGLLFFLVSPYTILAFPDFLASMHYESGVAWGTLPVPYTLQFTSTLPYLFHLYNFFWQLGPFALPAIVGFFFLFFHSLQKKDPKIALFLVIPCIYFLYVGSWHTKFIRFMIPILPFFIIAGSYFLYTIKKRFSLLGHLCYYFFIGITLLWTAAFFSIYIKEQTRITASKWIYAHIPIHSTLLLEHWDDGLPLPLQEENPGNYTIHTLTIYDQDNATKLLYYANELAGGDYMVINSRRLYGTLLHLPQKYPLTSTYYRKLFDNKLGYQKIAEFSSYPSLFGITINDDASEETFQVYDHPKVLIFKNISHLSQNTIAHILQQP